MFQILVGVIIGAFLIALLISMIQTFLSEVDKIIDHVAIKKLKSFIPLIIILGALMIIDFNFHSFATIQFNQDKGILFSLLEVKVTRYLYIYLLIIVLFLILWMLSYTLINFKGLKSFSGFGISAELQDTIEKVEEITEKNTYNNAMERLRENMLNIITSDTYISNHITAHIDNNLIINVDHLLNDFLSKLKYTYETSTAKIKISYHIETVLIGSEERSRIRIARDLSEEMKSANLDVMQMQPRRPTIKGNTLAIPHTPFGINNRYYYIISVNSENIEPTNTDIDFLYTCLKIIEITTNLKWYEKFYHGN